jgi:hypothetical protein
VSSALLSPQISVESDGQDLSVEASSGGPAGSDVGMVMDMAGFAARGHSGVVVVHHADLRRGRIELELHGVRPVAPDV